MTKYLELALLATLLVTSSAFQPLAAAHRGAGALATPDTKRTQVVLQSTKDKDKKKKSNAPFDEALRTKLVSESIAPWRTLRLFLYGSLGSGAALGGFITLAGTAAAISGARTDVDLNTEYLNLAIDFGAVAIFAIAAKFDIAKGAELEDKVDEKIEKKKQQKGAVREMKKREKTLQNLDLEIQVSLDGATKTAAVRDLQQGAQQNIIIVAGPRKAIRDALIGANLQKMDFAMSNVLVVPYDMEEANGSAAAPSGGFGERPSYEIQPYVARPTGDDWTEYIKEEMTDAVEQFGENAKEEGIAIVVANTGNVVRRGVGTVPWRKMVEQLQKGEEAEE